MKAILTGVLAGALIFAALVRSFRDSYGKAVKK